VRQSRKAGRRKTMQPIKALTAAAVEYVLGLAGNRRLDKT
jgi:hypothetical protein